MIRDWSLLVRLTAMVAVVLVPWLVVIAVIQRGALEERRGTEIESTRLAAESAASVVDAFLRDLETSTLALTLPLGRAPALDQASLGKDLALVAKQYAEIRSIFVTDTNGRVVAASTGEGLGTDLSSRSYIVRLRDGAEHVWSGSLTGLRSGEVTVAHARRIRAPDGSVRGAIAVAFYPERVLAALRLRVAADAKIVLVDERGQIVYSTEQLPPERADVSASPHVQRVLRGEAIVLRGEPGLIGSDPRYGALVPIPRTGWALVLTRPQADVDAAVIGPTLQGIGVTALVVTLGALLATLIALGIARPLRELTRSARAIGRGEHAEIGVSGGGPEIRELAATMANMQDAIARREEGLAVMTDELRRAVRTRDDFLTATAHDVRTPLAVLQAAAELLVRRLERGTADVDAVRDNVERIRSAMRRVQAQIDQLDDLTRVHAGKPLELQRRPTDLVALTTRVVAEVRAAAPDHSIRIDRGTLGELVGDWDPSRIERALTNILTNAVKFSPEANEIVVTLVLDTLGDRPAAVLEVRDRGIGIPADDLTRIRQPFARGTNAAHVPGSGLGLAIVHEVASSHGGELRIESEAGRGTLVALRLPLTPAPQREHEPQPAR